jgi:hypothetical protein
MKKSYIPPTANKCYFNLMHYLKDWNKFLLITLQKIGDVRFEDPAFRRFHDELTSKFTQIIEEAPKINGRN